MQAQSLHFHSKLLLQNNIRYVTSTWENPPRLQKCYRWLDKNRRVYKGRRPETTVTKNAAQAMLPCCTSVYREAPALPALSCFVPLNPPSCPHSLPMIARFFLADRTELCAFASSSVVAVIIDSSALHLV